MTSFTKAFKELFLANFIEDTNPHLVWFSKNKEYVVTYYFSKQTINRLGGEIIL